MRKTIVAFSAVFVAAFLSGCSGHAGGGAGSMLPSRAGTPHGSAPSVAFHNPVHVMKPPPPHWHRGMLPATAVVNMNYYGGPVQTAPVVYAVFWGYSSGSNDPDGVQTRVTNFLNAEGGTSWLDTLTQYWNTSGSNIGNPASNLAGTWTDTTNTVPSAPTSANFAAEAERAATHFGSSGMGNNAIYVIALPHAHSPSGFGTSFCAYHSWSYPAAPFVALPYMPDKSNCGESFVNSGASGTLDGVSIVLGHEIAEAMTDPYPTTGWNDGGTAEVADKCGWLNLQNTSMGGTTLGTDEFPTQPLWSNRTSSCVQSSTAVTSDSYQQAVLALSPSGYYRLDEGGGTYAADGSGHAANAVAHNTSKIARGWTGICCGSDTSYSFTNPGYLSIGTKLKNVKTFTVTAMISGSYSTVRTCVFSYYGDCFGVYDGYLGWGHQGTAVSQAIHLTDGTPYFVAMQENDSYSPALVTVSIDGGPQIPANPSGLGSARVTASTVDGGSGCATCANVSNIDEIAVWASTLSTANVAALASTAGFAAPTPSPAPTGYAATVLADSPLAYYRMDDSTGSAVYDSSGNAYHAYVKNPTKVTRGASGLCCGGTAYTYASTGYLQLPANMPTVTQATGYTIVAVINGTFTLMRQCIVDYQNNCFGIYHGSLGYAKSGSNPTQAVALSNAPHFVAMTQQLVGATNTVQVSVDGGSLTSANTLNVAWPAKGTSFINHTTTLCGTLTCGPVTTIDDVAIFPEVLSQSDINALAAAAGF